MSTPQLTRLMTAADPATASVRLDASAPPFWQPVLLAALAGGLGWGIRGQYGHETGAMIAGVLVSLVLVLVMCPRASWLAAARAVAFGTLAMGIGGSMTYGQTLGLTQAPELVGHAAAWRWGMLGAGLKGAIWIGFAGLFLGLGLGGRHYSWREILLLWLGLGVFYGLGWWWLNQPFDPANQILPRLYFSSSWHWQPTAGPELKPRPEVWGGLLFALLAAWGWIGWVRRDRLARNLALWGMLGGLGFPLGQCLQSFHAWHREMFQSGLWTQLDPLMNWWNWMETTFGLVLGTCLGCGLWLNRRLIRMDTEPPVTIKAPVEWVLVIVHVTLLIIGEFTGLAWANALYDPGLIKRKERDDETGIVQRVPSACCGGRGALVAVAGGAACHGHSHCRKNHSPSCLRGARHRLGCRLAVVWSPAGGRHPGGGALVGPPRPQRRHGPHVRAPRFAVEHVVLLWLELRLLPLSLGLDEMDGPHAERNRLHSLRRGADGRLLDDWQKATA